MPWIYGQGKGRKEGLNVSSTSPSHRISIYFPDILPCRFNSFTRSLKVSTLPILEGKRLAGNLAPQTEHEREIGSKWQNNIPVFVPVQGLSRKLPQDRSPVLPLPSHYDDWESSRHGNPDRGRVESSPWAYGQGKGRKRGWESSCHGLRYPPL